MFVTPAIGASMTGVSTVSGPIVSGRRSREPCAGAGTDPAGAADLASALAAVPGAEPSGEVGASWRRVIVCRLSHPGPSRGRRRWGDVHPAVLGRAGRSRRDEGR
ncbi:hypothetical protein GCM10028787_15420 [Brachybacterium horti]